MVALVDERLNVPLAVESAIQINAIRTILVWCDISTNFTVHGLKINKIINALDWLFQSMLSSLNFISLSAASRIALDGASLAASKRIRISGLSNTS